MGTCGIGPTDSDSDMGSSLLDGETEEAMRSLNKKGAWPAVKPAPDWGLICGIVLAMLGLVGMLVFLTQK